jgi:galactosylceramidase
VQFKALLKSNNLKTKLHGFDNWGAGKWDFVNQFSSNTALANAIDALSSHTTNDGSEVVPAAAIATGKPIWDTEEHAYYAGYTCEQAIAHDVCANYVSNSKVTKTLFWYLIEAYYSVEQFANPHQTMAVASQPWSGHYELEPGLWGYAHFNQFADLTWSFIDAACGKVTGGGTYVTLKSPNNSDFSIIIETQNGSGGTLNFSISGGLPTNKTLCVWRSKTNDYFTKQTDITPVNGTFSISVDGASIYSISTTTGQQKGTFSTAIPASASFPTPYYENYDHYTGDGKLWGYLPYYQCDICGVFEIANSPTGTGKCLRQVLNTKANSWAPEWAPFTLIGNTIGTSYEVSADVYFDGTGGWAGVMGRVNQTGTYGCYPRGYYFHLASNGAWGLYYANGAAGDGTSLATGTATLTGTWHNVKLQMSGSTLTGLIENKQVCSVTNSSSGNGVAGLCTGSTNGSRNTACFDNLIINTVNGATPTPTVFSQDATPPYSFITVGVADHPVKASMTPSLTSYKVVGGQFVMPKEFSGKTVSASVYNLEGKLTQKMIVKGAAINLHNYGMSSEVSIVKLKAID